MYHILNTRYQRPGLGRRSTLRPEHPLFAPLPQCPATSFPSTNVAASSTLDSSSSQRALSSLPGTPTPSLPANATRRAGPSIGKLPPSLHHQIGYPPPVVISLSARYPYVVYYGRHQCSIRATGSPRFARARSRSRAPA